MEFNAAVCAALAFIALLSYYVIRARSTTTRQAPPEAGGAWPFLGHLNIISGRTGLPHVNLGNLADKHGPIFGIRIGVHRAVVVSSGELVKELFTSNDAAVSSRPSVKAGKHLAYGYAMLGFSSYDAYWSQLRKLVSLELFSARRVELQRNVRVSETAHFISDLYKTWEERRDGSGRVPVEMKELLEFGL